MSTLFDVSQETRLAERSRNHEYHLMNLVARLGDGSNWEHTGDCTEDPTCSGVCACKHTGLRWLFLLRHKETGDTAVVGSRCIEHFAEVNPDLVASVRKSAESAEQRAKDRLRAAKDLAKDREIETALNEYDEAAWELCRRVAQGAEIVGEWRGYTGTGDLRPLWRANRRVRYALFQGNWTPCRCAELMAEYVAGKRFPKPWKQYRVKSAFVRAIRAETEYVKVLSNGPVFI